MKLLHRPVGPIQTNVYLLGDEATREALVIDAAKPSTRWIAEQLAEQGWRLKLIISTHGHWDHIGDNAELQRWSVTQSASTQPAEPAEAAAEPAPIAVHPLDRYRLVDPKPISAPFVIEPSIPAIELAEGGVIELGGIRLEVIHTPGHTEGSVCLLERSTRLLFSGDTLFNGGWGRTDFPGGNAGQLVESLDRLRTLDDDLVVLPGHGAHTQIGWERPMLDRITKEGLFG